VKNWLQAFAFSNSTCAAYNAEQHAEQFRKKNFGERKHDAKLREAHGGVACSFA
jgi:hypothetical protein